jgi:hypothetical protein
MLGALYDAPRLCNSNRLSRVPIAFRVPRRSTQVPAYAGERNSRSPAPPLTYYACHCTDCQRRTGDPLRLAMWVAREALLVVQGSRAEGAAFESAFLVRDERGYASVASIELTACGFDACRSCHA